VQELIEAPGPTVRQVSGKDPAGNFILSVLAKRTYQLLDDGRLILAPEQEPLVLEPLEDPDTPQILAHDVDLYPYKPRTDLIVEGHAYGYGARRSFHATVSVEGHTVYLLVSGERRCTMGPHGRLLFSEPEPVERIALSYAQAYGGADRAAEEKYATPIMEVLAKDPRVDPSRVSPFLYPRNPAGRGYLVEPTAEGVEQLQLPCLEDPYDPLTPERLPVGHPLSWLKMPLPYAPGWLAHDWFPRIGYFGLVPAYDPPEGPIAEVARGFTPPDILGIIPGRPTAEAAFRATCGAAPMLQLPLLRGGETISLDSLHPRRQRFTFSLPRDRPRMWTDGRKGKLNNADPVLHTVLVQPDEGLLMVLWRGSAPALRPYASEELERMPLRVEWY
jgi:hypothetical protein